MVDNLAKSRMHALAHTVTVDELYEAYGRTDRPLRILLVEDEKSDVMLTQIALDATGLKYELDQLSRGADVRPYLMHESRFSDRQMPDLILLDLSLPDRDGFEILAELTALPTEFRAIPIAILTGLKHLEYLKNCYDLPIVDYIQKPCNAERMQNVMNHARQ